MPILLLDEHGCVAVPLRNVVEFVVLKFPKTPDSRIPGVSLVASLSPARPGPYRTLARWPEPDRDHPAAEDALAELAGLVSDSENRDGVLRWDTDTAGWAWVYLFDEQPIVEA